MIDLKEILINSNYKKETEELINITTKNFFTLFSKIKNDY